jgi:hypothetical protein
VRGQKAAAAAGGRGDGGSACGGRGTRAAGSNSQASLECWWVRAPSIYNPLLHLPTATSTLLGASESLSLGIGFTVLALGVLFLAYILWPMLRQRQARLKGEREVQEAILDRVLPPPSYPPPDIEMGSIYPKDANPMRRSIPLETPTAGSALSVEHSTDEPEEL